MAGTTVLLDWALTYAEAGLPVIPLHGVREDGSCTCGRPDCPSPGKHPRTRNGLKDATTHPETIRKWWSKGQWPSASIAGVGGEFLCLDVDVKSGGDSSLEKLVSDNSPLPETAVAETGEYDGRRGHHYWFQLPEDAERAASKIGIRKGIDIRCARGYAVLPPSPHSSGVNYEWLVPFEEVTEAPAWLLDLAPLAVEGESTWAPNPHFRQAKEVRDFLVGKGGPEPGEQRDFLTRAARSVLTTGKSVDEASELLFEGVDGRGGICACEASREPWTFEEILYLVEDVYRKPPTSQMQKDFSAEEYTWDDWGNALRLVDSWEEGAIFHVHEWGKWYHWDGEEGTWDENDGTVIRRQWEGLTKDMWDESFGSEDKHWIRFVSRARNRGATENAVYLARDYVRVSPKDLNADPYLLNCQNGVLDLREGVLLNPDPKLRLTKRCTAEYVEGATSALWDRIVNELIPSDNLRNFVQKAFGYTLTGSVEEHKFFYFYGPPGGGKTTLLETFACLLGNYSEACEPSTFMQNRVEGGPTEDIARLSNARMVTTHEVEEGSRWAEGRIAHLTGGDKVTARFLHQNSFEFYPQFKLFFSANHRPRVSGSANSGLWRRLMIVPIERIIPEEERDPMLLRKLREPSVLSAILSWALEGCRMWMEDNKAGHLMQVPQEVLDEVDEYKAEENHVIQFAQEMITKTDYDKDRYPKQDLYGLYRGWCTENGRRQMYTSHRLTKEMRALGYWSKNAQYDGKVKDCWIGIRIKGVPSHRG